MRITPLSLPGPLLIEPKSIADSRGLFAETFRADLFEVAAGPIRFVQENRSLSTKRGTIRGLHFQKQPRAQGKLVRAVRGAILDVVVDIRVGSPTYGQYETVELSAENWFQLWVPVGFLHGLCTLTDNAEVLYKVTDYYSREHDAGVRWNDPDIGVKWPASEVEIHLSEKDRVAPLLQDIGPQFAFEGG